MRKDFYPNTIFSTSLKSFDIYKPKRHYQTLKQILHTITTYVHIHYF